MRGNTSNYRQQTTCNFFSIAKTPSILIDNRTKQFIGVSDILEIRETSCVHLTSNPYTKPSNRQEINLNLYVPGGQGCCCHKKTSDRFNGKGGFN